MRNLEKFIDQKNQWNAIFNTAPMTFPLTQQEADELGNSIDASLSPENLHCDGEISAAEANRKYRFLTTVAQELEAYCKSNGLTAPTVYELY